MGAKRDLLLERDSELGQLEDALTAARSGDGNVVLVQGPAGIGKSRLLAAACERAAAAGDRVLRARGGELERDFAFGVARQLFEQAVMAHAPAERARLLEGAAGLAGPVVAPTDDPGVAMAGDRLFAVMHGLYWLTVNLAAQGPLVIAVDDAQLADEQSVHWFHYLARRLSDVPVLVVLCARVSEGGPEQGPLSAIAAEADTRVVEPGPLSVAAVKALLEDATAAGTLPEVARACHERSAGNPFLVRELAAAFAASEIAPDRPDAAAQVADLLPGTVARSVLQRLTALPAPAVALARAAAVLGADVHLVDAARLADLGDGAAADALDTLVDAGFILPGTPLRFAHPLMREAIYEDLPTGRRLYQHRRAADVLSSRIAPEQIAAHVLQCEPQGHADSVAVLRRCAVRATERGAPGTAVRYLTRALEEPPDAQTRIHVLHELGVAGARVGHPQAVEHLEEALGLASAPGDVASVASDLAVARGARGGMASAVETLERGVEMLAGRDRELELRLEGELGALGQLDVASTPRVAERLRRVAPELSGETAGERLVLASFAHLRSNELAPAEELVDLAQRAVGNGLLLAEQTADSPIVYLLIYVFFRADMADRADEWLAETLAEAGARGSLLGTSVALGVRAQLRWLRGELADAEADARTAIDAQVEAGWSSILPLAVAVAAECLLERGQPDEACELFASSGLDGNLPGMQTFRWAQASRGRARIAAGDLDAGLEDLRRCGGEQMGARADVALLWRSDAALALAARGDTDEARELAVEQLTLARDAGVPRVLGAALRTLGLVAGRDDALDLLREAVSVLEDSNAQLEHARALVELGAALRRTGQRGDARKPLAAGHELARRCGSTTLVERATVELAAAGVRMRRPALAGRDSLTPSERRVAELATSGMSNPEIAQALFVTRKTIEMHLGHVYRKLDVQGRDGLATVFADPPEAVAH